MSCNAWFEYEITVKDTTYESAFVEFAKEVDFFCNDERNKLVNSEGHTILYGNWDNAGYFYHIEDEFLKPLESIDCPRSAWRARCRYECFEDPFGDGAVCEFVIEDGEIASFTKSHIEMVECAPWFNFKQKQGE